MTGPSTDRLHVRALGITVTIEVRDERLRPLVQRAWSMAAVAPPRAGSRWATGPTVVAPELAAEPGPDDVAQTLQTLTQRVTQAAITARTGELMMFHAAGLCDLTTGATVALVAPGGTGKTTLVRTVGPGLGYVSDETVGVAADGGIDAYCKPLSVRRPDTGQPKDEVAPESLGLRPPAAAPWLAGLVMLRRDLEAGAAVVVEPVPVIDAIVLLAPETSSLASFDRPLRRLADLVESVGGLRRVRYHDAADVEPVVHEVLRRSR